MKINKDKIEYLAKLARLKFSEDECDNMVNDIQKILSFVDKLSDIDTSKIDALTHIHNNYNIFREDHPSQINIKSEILENAPKYNSDYIKVPKVIKVNKKS